MLGACPRLAQSSMHPHRLVCVHAGRSQRGHTCVTISGRDASLGKNMLPAGQQQTYAPNAGVAYTCGDCGHENVIKLSDVIR